MSLHNSDEIEKPEMDFSTNACNSKKLYWSSWKERKGNALALGAEEGRDKLRKASGSCK